MKSLLKLEKLQDESQGGSPDTKARHTRRYVIALREHLQQLNALGVELLVDIQRKDKGLIKALLFQNKKYKIPNSTVSLKNKSKLKEEDAGLESGNSAVFTLQLY